MGKAKLLTCKNPGCENQFNGRKRSACPECRESKRKLYNRDYQRLKVGEKVSKVGEGSSKDFKDLLLYISKAEKSVKIKDIKSLSEALFLVSKISAHAAARLTEKNALKYFNEVF